MKRHLTFLASLLVLCILSAAADAVTWFRQDFESPLMNEVSGQADGIGSWSGLKGPELVLSEDVDGNNGRALVISRINNYAGMEFRGLAPLPEMCNYRFGADFHLAKSNVGFIVLPNQQDEWVAGINVSGGSVLKIWGEDKVWVNANMKLPVGWFHIDVEVDVLQRTYTPVVTLADGTVQRGDDWPMVAAGTPVVVRTGNAMPVGNVAAIDDIYVEYDKYSATSGRNDVAAGLALKHLDDGALELELPGICEVSTFHADGVKGGAVTVSGFNAMGQWEQLSAGCRPDDDSVIHFDFRTARLSRVRIEGADAVDAVALYEVAGVSAHLADHHFQEKVYGEFYLPVYSTEECADLHLFNVGDVPLACAVTLSSRADGQTVQPEREVMLSVGENVLNFPLAGLDEGEYVAEVRQKDGERGAIRRLLRFQKWEEVVCKDVPDLRGQKMFFPDDFYFQRSRAIVSRAGVAKSHCATKRTTMETLKSFFQQGMSMYEEDGRLCLIYETMDNFFHTSTRRLYRISAPLDELDNWTEPVPVDEEELKRHRCGNVLAENVVDSDWSPKPGKDGKIRYRLYDAAVDGTPDVRQLHCYYVPWMPAGTEGGAALPEWEDVTPVRRSTWVIWHKEPGLSLIMDKEPLLVDGSSGQEFEGIQDSNDNFAGQWLSEDGKTLYYARGHIVRRYPPYNVPYDNGSIISRMLTIYSTRDGIHFTRRVMARPKHDFPPGTQHYGALIMRLRKGGGLMAALVQKYLAREQRLCMELVSSRDGLNWKTFQGQPLTADNGPRGSWNAGSASASGYAINAGGKTFVLMGWNCNAYHLFCELIWDREDFSTITASFVENYYKGRQIETWPLFSQFNGWEDIAAYIRNTCINVGVMEFREDGLFYAESSDGEFTTVPVRGAGKVIVNGETSGQYGAITVELLQDGRSLGTALLHGDELAFEAFEDLPDGEYQLRVHLKDAKLYCISFQ